jgi:hypothetical protein
MAVAFAVMQAAADVPTPAPATTAPAIVKLTLDESRPHTFEHLQPWLPNDAARAGGKHRLKKFAGLLSHFPLLIWDDVRAPDEILRYEGISSRPWTKVLGWHPGATFNEDCATHEPSCAVFTSSK